MCDSFHTLPANHRQQIVYLAMPHTETNKSQATNHTSCLASHRYHQITGNQPYILPCLTQMPTNHRQQNVHLAMPHTDTSKSIVERKSSRGYDLLRALGPASCDITHEAGDPSCEITHEPRARFVAMLTVCWNTKKQHVCDSFLTLKTLQLSKQDEFLPDLSIFDLKNLGFKV